MHRNTYINSSALLDNTYKLKNNSLDNNIYFAGQISGVEGYVESIASGMVAALNACEDFRKGEKENFGLDGSHRCIFSEFTMIGALAKYISTPNKNFQPMNANFGILPPLEGKKIKDKKLKYEKMSKRSFENLK